MSRDTFNLANFKEFQIGMDGKAGMGKREREKGVGKWERLFLPVTGQNGNGKRSFFPDGNFPFFPSRNMVKK